MAALAGYKASVYVTSTPSLTFTNLALVDGGAHTVFSVGAGNSAKWYWDETQPFTVQTAPDGSTWTTANPSTYTIQYVGGIITFNSAVTGGTPSARVSAGYYMPYSVVARAKSIEISNMLDILDATDFSSGGWKTKIAALAGSEYKLEQWWIDTFYASMLGNRMVVSAYTGANANQRFEGYAFIKDDSFKTAVNSLNEESISFESDGPVYCIQS